MKASPVLTRPVTTNLLSQQPHGWWPLVVIAAAHLMAILDTTIMFVALPSAQHALGLSTTTRQWILTAYTLTFAALLLLGGRLADRFGARRTLLIGVIGFALASAFGGAAVDGAMLVAARALQGACGALLVSSTKSLLITVYQREDDRTRAIGIFTATLTAGAAAGLILGGILTSELGWRWCLYVNILLSLVVIAGASRVLPNLPSRPNVRIDGISVTLASAGILALVYGLGEAPAHGWESPAVSGSLIAAAALLTAFVARQARRPNALLPLRVVRDRNRGGALLATVCNSLSTFGMMLILTYQLQSVMHYSALRTGFALTPFALAAAFSSAVLAPRLQKRFAPRWLIANGLLLSAAGLLPLVGLTPTSHYLPLILSATLIEGVGTGLGSPPMLQTTLRDVLPSDTGAASAAGSAAGQLGSSIGAALLNTIAVTATVDYRARHVAISVAGATVHGYAVAMLWGAAILLTIIIPAVILINVRAPNRLEHTGRDA